MITKEDLPKIKAMFKWNWKHDAHFNYCFNRKNCSILHLQGKWHPHIFIKQRINILHPLRITLRLLIDTFRPVRKFSTFWERDYKNYEI